MKPRWRLLSSSVPRLRALQLLAFAFFLLSSATACLAEEKAHAVSVESFVSSLDRDGDGEICTEEANKFLESVLETSRELEEEEMLESGQEARPHGAKKEQDTSMSELMTDHNLDISFSYGGSTISSAEMTEHLSHLLTLDHVVAWVTHGLRLPQYAKSFKLNSIDGLDFPTLISDNGSALRDEIGVSSDLHLRKIQNALVRQVFGIGRVPSPPQSLACQPVAANGRASAPRPGIMLHWAPPAAPGIPPVHKFLVKRRKIGEDGVGGPWAEIGDPSEESFVDSTEELEFGTEYEYRVQSWGGHGPSDWAKVKGCKVPSNSVSSEKQSPPPEKAQKSLETGSKPQICAPPEILALASPPRTPRGRANGVMRRKRTVQGRQGAGQAQLSFSLMPAASASAVSAERQAERQSRGGVAAPLQDETSGEDLCLPPPDAAAVGATPGTQNAASSARQASGDSSSANRGAGNTGEGGYTSWAVNLGILGLGLFSRSSLLWRAASTMGVVFSQAVQRCLPTEDSSSLVVRNFARALNLAAGAFQMLSLAVLIALGVTTVGNESEAAAAAAARGPGSSSHHSSGSGGRPGIPTAYPAAFSERSASGSQLERPAYPKAESGSAPRLGASDSHCASASSGSSMAASGHMNGSENSSLSISQGRSRSMERGPSEGGGSSRGSQENGNLEQQESGEGSSKGKLRALVSRSGSEKAAIHPRNRCNEEGCLVQWGNLTGFLLGLFDGTRKHFCQDCQKWFCVQHTRIASHGAHTPCRLDSQCRCYPCYAKLPAAVQFELDSINKLPQPKPPTSASPSLVSDGNGGGSKDQKRGSGKSTMFAPLPPMLFGAGGSGSEDDAMGEANALHREDSGTFLSKYGEVAHKGTKVMKRSKTAGDALASGLLCKEGEGKGEGPAYLRSSTYGGREGVAAVPGGQKAKAGDAQVLQSSEGGPNVVSESDRSHSPHEAARRGVMRKSVSNPVAGWTNTTNHSAAEAARRPDGREESEQDGEQRLRCDGSRAARPPGSLGRIDESTPTHKGPMDPEKRPSLGRVSKFEQLGEEGEAREELIKLQSEIKPDSKRMVPPLAGLQQPSFGRSRSLHDDPAKSNGGSPADGLFGPIRSDGREDSTPHRSGSLEHLNGVGDLEVAEGDGSGRGRKRGEGGKNHLGDVKGALKKGLRTLLSSKGEDSGRTTKGHAS